MTRLPVSASRPLPPAGQAAGQVPAVPGRPGGARPDANARERDYLMLTIFVLAQQGYVDRAGVLAEALYLTGDYGADVLLARAVLRFLAEEWTAALACLEELDRLDPVERFGGYTLDERQRMRRFLAARCHFELGDHGRARDSVDVYLRHAPGRDGSA